MSYFQGCRLGISILCNLLGSGVLQASKCKLASGHVMHAPVPRVASSGFLAGQRYGLHAAGLDAACRTACLVTWGLQCRGLVGKQNLIFFGPNPF